MADSYGTTPIFDDLRDLVYDNLVLLQAELTATTATIEYTYNRHNIAKLQLNALSCDFGETEQIPAGHSQGSFTDYLIEFNIRIHTGYLGRLTNDPVDTQEITRLIDSVNNWFMTHMALSSIYQIINMNNMVTYEEFTESATFGGSLNFVVQLQQDHIQV